MLVFIHLEKEYVFLGEGNGDGDGVEMEWMILFCASVFMIVVVQ